MNAHLAVVRCRSSQPIMGSGGAPIDLTDTALPTSARGSDATRLFRALADARREMRVRQSHASADAPSTLRLVIIETAQNGTALEVRTASTNLRTLDLQDEDDRETVLRELRALERELLGDD